MYHYQSVRQRRKRVVDEDLWTKVKRLGRCFGKPELTNTFFADQGGSVKEAKKMCWGDPRHPIEEMRLPCPIRETCLETHIKEEWGVWGGTSPHDRRRLRRSVSLIADPPQRCQVCFGLTCRCKKSA